MNWFLTLWQDKQGWHYRIERGSEREVVGQGDSVGNVPAPFVRSVVWREYVRLKRAKALLS